jgi:hypothetical protein
MYVYGTNFMNLAARARHSADAVIRQVLSSVPVDSVADFGCARGTWLAAWRRAGVLDTMGLDGPYVEVSDLEIPPQSFHACDLTVPIDLARRFALVQSLEVAEHLPPQAARPFVGSLTRHADIVLFSASSPGQGGENHLNEQPYDFWRDRFAEQGYVMIDWLRPRILTDSAIQYWYRYNCFLFVAESALGTVPADWREAQIPASAAVPDVAPVLFRMRKQVVRILPQNVQNSLSRLMSAVRSVSTS